MGARTGCDCSLCAVRFQCVSLWPVPEESREADDVRCQGVSSTDQCNTACSLSAGVSKPKVFRGRRLSRRAIALRCAWEMRAKLVPLGKYWRTKPLVFSLLP